MSFAWGHMTAIKVAAPKAGSASSPAQPWADSPDSSQLTVYIRPSRCSTSTFFFFENQGLKFYVPVVPMLRESRYDMSISNEASWGYIASCRLA